MVLINSKQMITVVEESGS